MIPNLKATKRKENSLASSKIMLIDTWQSMTPCDLELISQVLVGNYLLHAVIFLI